MSASRFIYPMALYFIIFLPFFLLLLLLWVLSLIFITPFLCFKYYLFGNLPKQQAEVIKVYKPAEKALELDREYSVAVIGAGWSGMQVAQCLIEKGMKVRIFEKLNDVGGTWHPDLTYAGLHLHAASFTAEFKGFPYTDPSKRDHRISAEEIEEYNKRFFHFFGLDKITMFNIEVTKVEEDKNRGQAKLITKDISGALATHEWFDLVVHTGFTCSKYIPRWEGDHLFKGVILHTRDIKEDVLKKLVQDQKKIVVVGGNKSSVDTIVALTDANCKNFSWVSRSTYSFWAYEMLGSQKDALSSAFHTIQRIFVFVSLLFISKSVFLWTWFQHIIGANVTPQGGWAEKFHGGIITQREVNILRLTKCVKSEIARFNENGIFLKNKRFVECDVIVCGTGYSTGLEEISLEVDGQLIQPTKITHLYQGLVIPEMRTFAVTAANIYSWGPRRAITMADHIYCYLVSHPSSEELKEVALKGRSINLVRHNLFSGSKLLFEEFADIQKDLQKAKLVTFLDGMKNFWVVLVTRMELPVQLNYSHLKTLQKKLI